MKNITVSLEDGKLYRVEKKELSDSDIDKTIANSEKIISNMQKELSEEMDYPNELKKQKNDKKISS